VPFKLSKFIVHFRTRDTTRLFTVELLSDSRVIYRSRTLAQGDYLTKEQLTPDSAANAFQFPPIALHGPIEIRLLISGLQGGGENLPGDFFLVGVDAEFIRQGLATGETTTSVDKRLPAGSALPPPVAVGNQQVVRDVVAAQEWTSIVPMNIDKIPAQPTSCPITP
jgi:hypothetical protein